MAQKTPPKVSPPVHTVANVTSAPHTQVIGGCEQYRPLVERYGWDVRVAMAVMQAENHSCTPWIDNKGLNKDGSVDYGLMQVNSIHSDMVQGNLESLRNPEVNIAVAYRVYAGSGWRAWSTYNRGDYLNYLK